MISELLTTDEFIELGAFIEVSALDMLLPKALLGSWLFGTDDTEFRLLLEGDTDAAGGVVCICGSCCGFC